MQVRLEKETGQRATKRTLASLTDKGVKVMVRGLEDGSGTFRRTLEDSSMVVQVRSKGQAMI